MPSSTLDAATREFMTATRPHVFMPLTVDGQTFDCCTRCGKTRAEVRLPGKDYDYHPCRGLVG
jgi:hypothetical protein